MGLKEFLEKLRKEGHIELKKKEKGKVIVEKIFYTKQEFDIEALQKRLEDEKKTRERMLEEMNARIKTIEDEIKKLLEVKE